MNEGVFLSSERIAAIEARCEAATLGPWKCWNGWGPVGKTEFTAVNRIGPEGDPWDGLIANVDYPPRSDFYAKRADLEFVAAARADVPDLLAAAKALPDALAEASHLRTLLYAARTAILEARAPGQYSELLSAIGEVLLGENGHRV